MSDAVATKQPSAWRRAYREALLVADMTGRVQLVYFYWGGPCPASAGPFGVPAFAVAPTNAGVQA